MPAVVLNIGGQEWRRIIIPHVTPGFNVPVLRYRKMKFTDGDVMPDRHDCVMVLKFLYCFEDDNGINVYELDGVI